MPREGKAGPRPMSSRGPGQRWLTVMLWCPQLCEETWPPCLVEGRGWGEGVDILLGTRPLFSGSRDLAEGMRFGLRQANWRKPQYSSPQAKGAQGLASARVLRTVFSCSSKTCSQADMERVPQFSWRESYCSQTPKVRLLVREGGWPLDPWGWVAQRPMQPKVGVRIWGATTPSR